MMSALVCSLTVVLSVAFAAVSARVEGRMLAHDVYFSLKDDSPQAKEKLIVACKKYLTEHPAPCGFPWASLPKK